MEIIVSGGNCKSTVMHRSDEKRTMLRLYGIGEELYVGANSKGVR